MRRSVPLVLVVLASGYAASVVAVAWTASGPTHGGWRVGSSNVPLGAIAGASMAGVLLALGLLARRRRPAAPDAAAFCGMAATYAIGAAAVSAWESLRAHPGLSLVGLVALVLAGPATVDFIVAPAASAGPGRSGWRRLAWTGSLALLAAMVGCAAWAAAEPAAGARAWRWGARLLAVQLLLCVLTSAAALAWRWSRLRAAGTRASAGDPGRLRWSTFGAALALVTAAAVTAYYQGDPRRLAAAPYRPYAAAVVGLWVTGATLAALRIGLAEARSLIHRFVSAAIASGLAVGVYAAVLAAIAAAVEPRAAELAWAWRGAAVLVAAALFEPARRRAARMLERAWPHRRSLGLRTLRDLRATTRELREPPELAREVVERAVHALGASHGALYEHQPGAARPWVLLHARGDDPAAALEAPPPPPTDGGLAVRVEAERVDAVLRFGPRLDGELYGRREREALDALAGELAHALQNARRYRTSAEMLRTLEQQHHGFRAERDRLRDENRHLKQRLERVRGGEQRIVGRSAAARALRERIERVAAGESAVLLRGESGSGKGLVARLVHARSPRAAGPFVEVDCAAVPPDVFARELLGQRDVGGVRQQRGLIELADGGTLVLDAVHALPAQLQQELLGVLTRGAVVRVGGGEPVDVTVRVVAATDRDLASMASGGELSAALYAQLAAAELAVPPLRARLEDLSALVDTLLPELCSRRHTATKSLSSEALQRLKGHRWPGNARELELVLERAVLVCSGPTIEADDLMLGAAAPPAQRDVPSQQQGDAESDHRDVMQSIERDRLLEALEAAGGNRSRAARTLGIPRTTLLNKLRRHGIL